MFENIGGKIKGLAKICCIIGMVAYILLGCALIFAGNVINGIVMVVGGCLVSWIASLAVYGFGELIETTADNNYQLHEIEKSLRQLTQEGE